MSSEANLKRRIDELERRIHKLELALIPGANKSKKISTDKPLTLAQHINVLRDSAYFTQPRTANEVHKKLSSNYNCILNRVEVALVRLATKKQLRKASKIIEDKSYKSYVW